MKEVDINQRLSLINMKKIYIYLHNKIPLINSDTNKDLDSLYLILINANLTLFDCDYYFN